MQLPNSPPLYSQQDQAHLRSAIAQADGQNQKITSDIDLRNRSVYIYSPSGARWQLVASDAGALSLVAA